MPIAINIIGPFENKNLAPDDAQDSLTIIDTGTRFIEIIPLKETSGATVARCIDTKWFCRYHRPLKITSDQGCNLLSNKVSELLTR